jgi:hypothetical protein
MDPRPAQEVPSFLLSPFRVNRCVEIPDRRQEYLHRDLSGGSVPLEVAVSNGALKVVLRLVCISEMEMQSTEAAVRDEVRAVKVEAGSAQDLVLGNDFLLGEQRCLCDMNVASDVWLKCLPGLLYRPSERR